MSPEIRKTIVIDAPPQVVFKALTDEKQLTEWFPSQAILQARVGGAMEFQFQRQDGSVDHKVVGKILEIVPGKKLSFSWKNTSDPDFPDTVVTWTLEPADGKTRVTLVHTGFEKGRWLDLHDGGWSYFMGRLDEYSTKGRVESRQMFKELGKEIRKAIMVDAPASEVFRALTDEKELAQWFSNQGAILEARVGGKAEFRFLRPDGEKHTFRGKVLEIIPGKKLSYSWNPAIDHAHSEDEVITWTLEPAGDGRTRVTVVHTGLKESQKDVEAGFSYEAGWTHFLNQLVEHCKNKKK